VYETHLLRRTFRENGAVRNETLANLSHLPAPAIEAVKRSLHGEVLVGADDAIVITRSLFHGPSAAVVEVAKSSRLLEMLGPPSRQRDVVLGLLCAQVCEPSSKLAYTTWFSDTTLGADLGLVSVSTDECYEAMDWLMEKKDGIEKALVDRHLGDGSLVCYDLSSSYVEGTHNELAAFGHNRDDKHGKRQVEYGVIATTEGLPCAIEVFAGNTSDPASFCVAVDALKGRFGLSHVVLVGDRGMITSARIEALKEIGGLDWVSALRAPQIKALASDDGPLQLSLFDQVNLVEITHPDYPGERLVVCRNPALAAERTRKRQALLEATEAELDKMVRAVFEGRLVEPAKIGVRVGRVINRFKMAKHIEVAIGEGSLAYARKYGQIAAEAALDGIYVLRTSCTPERRDTNDVVRVYRSLAGNERVFRSMKSVDLEIRPIRHRLADRVRAHGFICLLAAHLVYLLREAWAPLTYKDEEPPLRDDPVAPARRSGSAPQKAAAKHDANGAPLRSFQGLLDHLSTLTRNTCQVPGTEITFERLVEPTETQRRAFELLGANVPLRLL
jgi:transposase